MDTDTRAADSAAPPPGGAQKLARNPAAVSSEVLDEMVVYVPDRSQALSLNESARAIWELCDGSRTLDDLCAELGHATGLAPSGLRDEVAHAVERLCELGALRAGG
jgi:hypothetical protein